MSEFPQKFSVESEAHTTHYTLADDYLVVTNVAAEECESNVEFRITNENLAVCRKADCPVTAQPTGPVYRLGRGGPLAIPTGKVFVRLCERAILNDRRDKIERAGFKIAQVLPYAPYAGWVEPISGRIADALRGFAQLKLAIDAVHVEPQMLMQSQSR